jgi:hypothetical protein
VSGYTPIFDSVFQGSLCGKYPDLPVWLVLLALQQRGGIIDAHPSYIATISGIPQADIEAAIARFCLPDEHSRTPDHDGRRLEPIEGAGFGWRVLNHRKYQEKARLEAKNAKEVTTGKNAERMQHRSPPQTAADRRTPPQTDPSYSYSNNKNKKGADAPVLLIEGLDPKAWADWVAYRKSIGKPLKPASHLAAQKEMLKLGSRQAEAVQHSIANGYTGCYLPGGPQSPSKKDPYAGCIN